MTGRFYTTLFVLFTASLLNPPHQAAFALDADPVLIAATVKS